MTAPIIMLIVGLLLILLEFFLPGGIMGVAGGVVLVLGLILFAVSSPSFLLTIGVVVATLVLLILLVHFVLKRIRSTKSDASIYLRADQAGYKASGFAHELIGREGEVRSDLKPAGHILIDKKTYQAVSQVGYIPKGTQVVVMGGEGAHLIVKEKK